MYVRLIPWTLQSGSEQLLSRDCLTRLYLPEHYIKRMEIFGARLYAFYSSFFEKVANVDMLDPNFNFLVLGAEIFRCNMMASAAIPSCQHWQVSLQSLAPTPCAFKIQKCEIESL